MPVKTLPHWIVEALPVGSWCSLFISPLMLPMKRIQTSCSQLSNQMHKLHRSQHKTRVYIFKVLQQSEILISSINHFLKKTFTHALSINIFESTGVKYWNSGTSSCIMRYIKLMNDLCWVSWLKAHLSTHHGAQRHSGSWGEPQQPSQRNEPPVQLSKQERLSRAPCRLRVDTAWRYGTSYGMKERASWDCTGIVQRLFMGCLGKEPKVGKGGSRWFGEEKEWEKRGIRG